MAFGDYSSTNVISSRESCLRFQDSHRNCYRLVFLFRDVLQKFQCDCQQSNHIYRPLRYFVIKAERGGALYIISLGCAVRVFKLSQALKNYLTKIFRKLEKSQQFYNWRMHTLLNSQISADFDWDIFRTRFNTEYDISFLSFAESYLLNPVKIPNPPLILKSLQDRCIAPEDALDYLGLFFKKSLSKEDESKIIDLNGRFMIPPR